MGVSVSTAASAASAASAAAAAAVVVVVDIMWLGQLGGGVTIPLLPVETDRNVKSLSFSLL